jgi:hypothetical protein
VEKVVSKIAIGRNLEADLGDIELEPAGKWAIQLNDGRTGLPYLMDNKNQITARALDSDGKKTNLGVQAAGASGQYVLTGVPSESAQVHLEFSRHLSLVVYIDDALRAKPEKTLGVHTLDPGQTVRGVIHGPNGETVAGEGSVRVYFQSNTGNITKNGELDRSGNFVIEGVPAGPAKYDVMAFRQEGYNQWIQNNGQVWLHKTDIEILPGQDTVLDLKFPSF